MPHLKRLAQQQPDKPAVRMADGSEELSFAELDRRADAVARWLLSLDLEVGATVALLLENHLRCFPLWWGIRRAGLYYAPISTHAQRDEIVYLLRDCDARLLVTSRALAATAGRVLAEMPALPVVMADGAVAGFASYEEAVAAFEGVAGDLPERPLGREFFYSSGTTGRPKGIRRPMLPYGRRDELPPLERHLRAIFRFDRDSVFLSPSPLYHATARFNIRTIESGGTAVVMPKFDAAAALQAIERHRVTHAHFVPTMFVRMLALDDCVRAAFDGSSLRCAMHGAAPCPPHVKRQLIDWWGPLVDEYYGGSENAGVTYIDCADWLAHPGSVGRAIWGRIHIVGDDGAELAPGEIGSVFFSGSGDFRYHNDPEKTARAFDSRGWSTYGDMGHVDADGYLYLSDRRADLIISGGVNLYPAEIENVLLTHPDVDDVAVVGVANDEFGEEVKAVVQLKPGAAPSPALVESLQQHCRHHLSRLKCPRSVDFVDAVPRSENGKLLRRIVKESCRRTVR